MSWLLTWFVIYLQLLDSAHCNQLIRIGALFTEEEKDSQLELAFKYAVYRINNDRQILPNVTLIYDIQYIPPVDSFHASKKACLQIATGVIAIFGPKDPELGVHIQSLCDALEIPHLEARLQNLGERDINKEFSINLHPGSTAISESLRDLIIYLNWTKVAIIYEDDMSLIGLQELVKPSKLPKNLQFVFRKCNGDNFREILIDIRSRNIFSIIIDIRPSSFPSLLTADVETLDLENFRYNFVNMTAFRLVDSNNLKVRSLLHDIEKFQPIGQKILNRSYVIEAAPALIFDSVYVLAYALKELLKNNVVLHSTNATCESDTPWSHGSSLFNYINLVEFSGLTGRVQFKEGVRNSIKLDLMKLRKNSLDKVGEWNKENGLKIKQPEAFHEFGPTNITLVVTTIEQTPYVMRKKDANLTGNARFEGFCIDLLQTIAEQLGFHYQLYLVPDGAFGAQDVKTQKWNGMVNELIDKKADLAVAPMTITYTRENVIDFTKPFMSLGIGILFRIPSHMPTRLFSFMNPLAFNIWCYVLGAYILVSFTLYIVSQFTPFEWKIPKRCQMAKKDFLQNQFSIDNAFWFLVVTLMKQGVNLNPKAFSTRIIAAIWWFFTLILISSYTANLAAFLTVEKMITPIEDVEDLAAQTKIQYGTLENGSTMTFFRDSKVPTYQKMWKYMISHPEVFVKTYEEGLKRVLDGNYAFLMESTMLDFMAQRDCNLTRIGSLLDSKGYGLATPIGSPWRDKVSLSILDLQEKGVIQMLYDKWWKSPGLTCIRDEIKNKDGKADALGLENIGGVFVVLIAGLIFAIFVAFFEFFISHRKHCKDDRQSFFHEMFKELKFALNFTASRQRPKLRRTCSNCTLVRFNKTSKYDSNSILNHHNIKSLHNSSKKNTIDPNSLEENLNSHQLFQSQFEHKINTIHQNLKQRSNNYKLKNNDCVNLNNYYRQENDVYDLTLNTPQSLQNLLLLNTNEQLKRYKQCRAQFASNPPTPPPPPPPLIKQKSLVAIGLEKYSDVHLQHHLETLAHQFHDTQNDFQLPTTFHRNLSNENFEKCNLINLNDIRNTENEKNDILFKLNDYSPKIEMQYTIDENDQMLN
uniref:Glutamate receptor ionotropic kainate 2 n=1 Tax=Polyphagotarsonemus latus TaxID=1204166 RepID=A0AAN0LHJ5_9ACAR